MTATQVLQELNTLPKLDRARIVEQTLRQLTTEERRPIERLIRRLQHPDLPESFSEGVEDHEDGCTVDIGSHDVYKP